MFNRDKIWMLEKDVEALRSNNRFLDGRIREQERFLDALLDHLNLKITRFNHPPFAVEKKDKSKP